LVDVEHAPIRMSNLEAQVRQTDEIAITRSNLDFRTFSR
jgi:hypothetical protein